MIGMILFVAAGFLTMLGAVGVFGYGPVYLVVYGMICLWAAMISGTFVWLWAHRKNDLALGMAFSWAGTAGVQGWWWVYNLFEQPPAMINNPALFLFLALYVIGASAHFNSIGQAIDLTKRYYWIPPLVAAGASLLIALTF